jgi:rare lipoprotein A
MRSGTALGLMLAAWLAGGTGVAHATSAHEQTGIASWYGLTAHGRTTASGETMDRNALTAAHRSWPFGTRVLVTNLDNGETVVVTVNDRGPFAHGRVLDVSRAAARELGMERAGTARVRLRRLPSEGTAAAD